MKIKPRHILTLTVIGAFCLMLLGMSVCVAKESPQFVTVESEHIDYDTVYGTDLIKNGSKVSIEVVLSNFSTEIEGNISELLIHSDLGVPQCLFDGVPKAFPYVVDHRKVEKVKVTLIGDAPEVNKRTEEPIILLNITQKIKEVYPVIEVKRNVSSEAIEDAITAIDTAKNEVEKASWVIANTTGVDVSGAQRSLDLANEYLNNSFERYSEGKPKEALEEAERALDSAKEAADKARAAIGGKTKGNVTIIAAVVVIAIVALLLLIQKRRRKRGIF